MAESQNDLFVGCSSDFLKLPWAPAEAIRSVLHDLPLPDSTTLAVNIWQDWFKTHDGMELFQILDLAAKTSEWAALVFRADDLRRSLAPGSMEVATVRDNVLFELGLFYGYLGTQRVFILEQEAPSTHAAKVASDVAGIQRFRFSDRASFIGALEGVRSAILKRSSTFFPRWVPAAALAIGYCEQALRRFIGRRRDFDERGRGSFKIEILVPFESFKGLEVSEVHQLFRSAGYEETGPEGSPSGRPTMWIPRGEHESPPEAYFDVPTTLLTAQRVIDGYLGPQATPDEITRLVGSQARAFARYVQSQRIPEVTVRKFADVEEIDRYLRGRSRGA